MSLIEKKIHHSQNKIYFPKEYHGIVSLLQYGRRKHTLFLTVVQELIIFQDFSVVMEPATRCIVYIPVIAMLLFTEQEVVESSCGAAEGCGGVCRSLKFATPSVGYALEGHVIKNISLSVGMGHTCKERCAMERTCVSFNIGPPINNKVLCQLSDSDRSLHPGHLKGRKSFTYRDTEVCVDLRPLFFHIIIVAKFKVSSLQGNLYSMSKHSKTTRLRLVVPLEF